MRTNIVSPGWIETELNREYLWSEPDLRERVVAADPARTHGHAGRRGAGGGVALHGRGGLRERRGPEVDGGLVVGRVKA